MTAVQQIIALLHVQYRTLLNSMKQRSGRRGRVISIGFTVIWYALWITAAVGCALVPNLIGREDVEVALPGLLLFVMAYWQLAPLVTMSLGVSLEMRKVSVYPVSVPTLFAVECLLRLGTGSEMVLLLCGLFGGLVLASSPHVPELGLAFVLFVALNVFFSAGLRNWMERIFQERRLRDVVLILLVTVTVLPQLFIWSETARGMGRVVLEGSQQIPYWMFPSGLAAQLSVGKGRPQDLLMFLGMVGAAALFGYVQFRGSCLRDAPASRSAQRRRRAGVEAAPNLTERIVRLPSFVFKDPVAALVEKELRYLWRSPRFRLPFFMGFTFGVIAWVPLMAHWETSLGGWVRQNAVSFVSLYAFLLLGPVLFLNRFGFDRQAIRFYFWVPVAFERLLLAKNLATGLFALLEAALVAAVCRLMGLPVGPQQLLEAAAVACIALLYLVSIGNHVSVHFPTPCNPERVSSSGPGHGLRAAVQFLVFPLASLPVLIALAARYHDPSNWRFLSLLLVAGAGGLLLYRASLHRSATHAVRNREEMIVRLSQAPGPVASE